MHIIHPTREKITKEKETSLIYTDTGFFYSKSETLSIPENKVIIAYILGREWKISLAELISLFGNDSLEKANEQVAIFSLPMGTKENLIKNFQNVGGSVRMIEIYRESDVETFHTDVIETIKKEASGGKYTFALGQYGGLNLSLFSLGIRIKNTVSGANISSRIANKDNTNLHVAAFKKEKLSKSGGEWNLLKIGEKTYFGKTLAAQDIDNYARRDTAKIRDMDVGMLPPKLAQMMINLSGKNNSLYDPFCGLGTVLIEGANMGITHVLGSDLSSRMVEASEKSLSDFIKEERVWQERIKLAGGTPAKDFSNFQSDVIELDATKIVALPEKSDLWKSDITIISEGYLGEVMQKDSKTLERVKMERSKLSNMYDAFFSGLRSLDFTGNIVITFPFWDIRGTHSFFIEIEDILARHHFEITPLLPKDLKGLLTQKGTLLYKRPGQNVGREVTKIRKKA
ncbi:hypothetical protein KBB25_02730 [Candidatus Gracilibacteria bacterium]|nr:hypothetical protein [Candidatus Gracilibacteria bacterium]